MPRTGRPVRLAQGLRHVLECRRDQRLRGNRHPDEGFLDTLDRIGIDPFKNRVYENRAHGKAKAAETEAA